MREIARKAEADAALVTYYFGGKRELFDEVLLRRATELNAIRLKELEELEANAGPDGPTVEEIINAFTHPLLDRTANGGPGWKSYFALIGQITNTPEWGAAVMNKYFDPIVIRFLDALKPKNSRLHGRGPVLELSFPVRRTGADLRSDRPDRCVVEGAVQVFRHSQCSRAYARLHRRRHSLPSGAFAGTKDQRGVAVMSIFTQHTFTAADGIRTAYRRYQADSGKLPVVCLHGLTRNSKDFEDVAPRIAASGRTVIAVDVRGRGQSDRGSPPEMYNPQVYVEDLFGVLGQEGIGHFISIGTSMGGLMTMIAAAMHPGVLAGAVLNDIGPELDPAGLNRIAGYVGRSKAPMANWQEAAAAVRAVNGEAFPR